MDEPLQPWTIHRQFILPHILIKRKSMRKSWSNLFHIVTRKETFPSSNPACPPAWWICRGKQQRDTLTTIKSTSWQTSNISGNNITASRLFLFTLLLHSIFFLFIHTPSLTRSNTSLTSKLISSVSCPTYWYNARQRGPWGRGCGFGAGGGRWLMLLLLCFLWQRDKPTKNEKSWRWLEKFC